MHVEILPLEGKVKHLGQMITFVDQETTEVQTTQLYLLRHRLHLFDAVVTPTLTYGAGTWATVKEHAECFNSSYKQNENTKTRRKLKEETLATTKSANRLKKKSAHMLNATKTRAFHSTTMKKAQQVMTTILKTGMNTLKEAREKLTKKNADILDHKLD